MGVSSNGYEELSDGNARYTTRIEGVNSGSKEFEPKSDATLHTFDTSANALMNSTYDYYNESSSRQPLIMNRMYDESGVSSTSSTNNPLVQSEIPNATLYPKCNIDFKPMVVSRTDVIPQLHNASVNTGNIGMVNLGLSNSAKLTTEDPVMELEREINASRHMAAQSIFENEMKSVREKYKPQSSIPRDLSSSEYADQCIAAAISSRLPPYRLHPGEYTLLRQNLPAIHVTTYLNIRNGILRLWLANPTVAVTIIEATGCVRDARFYGLAEFAFEWLVQNGYINHGIVDQGLSKKCSFIGEKPRQTIAIIGAGIAGLSCARQLDSLLMRYRHCFNNYEDVPRVMVLEGRRRIGGRIYTVELTDRESTSNRKLRVDLGADTIHGFGNGNPLATLVRSQLGLPIVPIEPNSNLRDSLTGETVDPVVDYRAHELFNHLLEQTSALRSDVPPQITASGDQSLIKAARDPANVDAAEEGITIAKLEEKNKPYENPGKPPEHSIPLKKEAAFLKSLGFVFKNIDIPAKDIHPLPNLEPSSLGCAINCLEEQLQKFINFSEIDIKAKEWYCAKFEYYTGGNIDKQDSSAWSHLKTNRFTGSKSRVKSGQNSIVQGLATLPTKLDVRFNTQIKLIEYDDDGTMLSLANGEQIAADKVVVTVPLGVLKKRTVQFIPDLPQWKTDSIERLNVGVINKVILVFKEKFWDTFVTIRACGGVTPEDRGACFMFNDLGEVDGLPAVCALYSGLAAEAMASRSDEDIVNECVERFKTLCNKAEQTVELSQSLVTRWQLDPYTLGAYSYVGVNGSIVNHDLLSRPVQQTVFFAGEATSRLYPGTVHGAYLSGLRAAKDILTSLIGPIHVPDNVITLPDTTEITPPLHVTPPVMPSSAPPPLSVIDTKSRVSLNQEETIENQLQQLRHDRLARDNVRMEQDLISELGERPEHPKKSGAANPFLLFQKDYWNICRKEADEQRQSETRNPNLRASRNRIRAALGKKWKTLAIEEKQPYLEEAQKIKDANEQLQADFARQLDHYDVEASNFRQRWKLENKSRISEQEQQLSFMLAQLKARRKRARFYDYNP